MTLYSLGFMFSENRRFVALINKIKPRWQSGLLNGIGGKLEPGESFVEAMVREFQEETGVATSPSDWREICVMESPRWKVVAFSAFSDCVFDVKTLTEEKVNVVGIQGVFRSDDPQVSNLPWLIALALDPDNRTGGSIESAKFSYTP